MYDMSYWTRQLVGLLIRTLILVLFLLTVRGALGQVDPRRRAMRPDLVFLNLIPLFDYAWIFVTLVKVRDSVRAEYQARGWGYRPETSFVTGLISAVAYVVVFALSWFPLFVSYDAVIWPLALVSVVCLIFWITYWVKISRVRQVLQTEAYFLPENLRSKCPSCGTAVHDGDEFCRSCGSRLAALPGAQPGTEESALQASALDADGSTLGESAEDAPVACPHCGADYRPNARFCSVCGRPAL